MAATARGRLRINAPLTFGNLHLAPLWGEFLKLHPAVELRCITTDTDPDLARERIDARSLCSRSAWRYSEREANEA